MKTETTKETTTVTVAAKGTPNNPNAKILIHAMQHLGYDNYVALCDIIDNSIDANATEIKVYVSGGKNGFQIIIQDNGSGMDFVTLDEALKFGSDTHHDEFSDLGKYGMGLSTAGLSLADKTTVFTKCEGYETVLKSATDVKVIKEENAFVKYLGTASLQERAFVYSCLNNSDSGTIVVLEECHGVKNKNVTQFSNKLIKEIARKYRKFMDSISFYVNDKLIAPADPLMLTGVEEGYESEIYSDEEYEVNWMDKESGTKRTGKVKVKLVLLPDTSSEKAKELGINMANQGFSILRNNREIANAVMPWHTKHNSLNRVRGEIAFDSSLDEAMGVNFTKNNIDMVDSVDDTLAHALAAQIDSMKKKSGRNKKVTEEEITSHAEAEDVINKKAKVLITPPAKKEFGSISKDGTGRTSTNNSEQGQGRGLQRTDGSYKQSANVRFETSHSGPGGVIFEADQVGKTTVITWNVDHPFYSRFVKENADNKTLVTSVDFLIYSLASAQIQAIGDDAEKAQMIENIIAIMSTNMKVLLS